MFLNANVNQIFVLLVLMLILVWGQLLHAVIMSTKFLFLPFRADHPHLGEKKISPPQTFIGFPPTLSALSPHNSHLHAYSKILAID